MEFPFDIDCILKDEISIFDKSTFKNYLSSSFSSNRVNYNLDRSEFKLGTIIDKLGEESAKAQGLPAPVTTSDKLIHSDHRLYIIKEPATKKVVGLLKVGFKTLFLSQPQQELREYVPLCVLDFYIHQSRQRRGFGHRLFHHMLQKENVAAHQLALDRPSPKLLAFMQRHYGLDSPLAQLNNFVVFPVFFSSCSPVNVRRRSLNKELDNWSPSIADVPEEDTWTARSAVEYSKLYYSPQSKARHKYFRRSLPPGTYESSSWNVLGVPPPDYRH